MAAGQFEPLPSALGVDARFCSETPTVLVLKEHFSWSGGDYSITTSEKQEVLRCSGSAMSFSKRKDFTTPQGETLYTLRNDNFSIPKSYYLEGPSGEKFLHLDSHWNLFGGGKFDVSFKNSLGNGQDVMLEVKGDFFKRDSDISWDGRPVARVRQDMTQMRNLFGPGVYGVEVAPHVDLALMCAIIVGLEEYRDARRGAS